MKLRVDGIGKIRDTEIGLDGITVVAGPNNTGKSTLGKALFALVNSFSNEFSSSEKEIENALDMRISDYFEELLVKKNQDSHENNGNRHLYHGSIRYVMEPLARDMTQNLRGTSDEYSIQKFIQDYESKSSMRRRDTELFKKLMAVGDHSEFLGRCVRILGLSDDSFSKEFSRRTFSYIFDGQVCSRLIGGTRSPNISLLGDDGETLIYSNFSGDRCVESFSRLSPKVRAILVDSPDVLDTNSYGNWTKRISPHNLIKHLLQASDDTENVADSLLAEEDSSKILNILNKAYQGELDQNSDDKHVVTDDMNVDEPITAVNSSKGIKAIVMLKTLIERGIVKPGDFLILDEPEIHLHPEWQIIYAHALVLISKDLDVKVLVTTHSPYFLHALYEFSKAYGLNNNVKVYSPDSLTDGAYMFKERTKEGIADLLGTMAKPFEDMRRIVKEIVEGR